MNCSISANSVIPGIGIGVLVNIETLLTSRVNKTRFFLPAVAHLDRAAKTGYKMSRVIGFEEVLNGSSLHVYSDRRWINPMDNVTPPNPRATLDLAGKNVAGGISRLIFRVNQCRLAETVKYFPKVSQ